MGIKASKHRSIQGYPSKYGCQFFNLLSFPDQPERTNTGSYVVRSNKKAPYVSETVFSTVSDSYDAGSIAGYTAISI